MNIEMIDEQINTYATRSHAYRESSETILCKRKSSCMTDKSTTKECI